MLGHVLSGIIRGRSGWMAGRKRRTVPAEDDGAKAEAIGFYGTKELALRHDLPSEDAVNIDA